MSGKGFKNYTDTDLGDIKECRVENPGGVYLDKELGEDFPKVRYNYTFGEVAFLFHKLKQFGKKFKTSWG